MESNRRRNLYCEIQKKIIYMIPERWEKIYLYASVIENINFIETGEMFFYYIPKGILKKNPVNVYEVPAKFNIDEQEYINLAEDLYDTIKDLREEFRKSKQRVWSNIVISIDNSKFKVECRYENLINTKFNNYDRRIIFKYKYLDMPLECFKKSERSMIQDYLIEEKLKNEDCYEYKENIYTGDIHNFVEYGQYKKEKNYYDEEEYIPKKNKRKNKKNIEEKEDENITSKNQILNL